MLALFRPKLDFVVAPTAEFPYDIVSPGIRRIKGYYALTNPGAVVAAAAWQLYSRQPRAIQNAGSAIRLRLRQARGFVHVLGEFPASAETAFVRRLVEQERPTLILADTIFNYFGRFGKTEHWT